MKYKVGDRVKFLGGEPDWDSSHLKDVGKVGTITKCDGSHYCLSIPNTARGSAYDKKCTWYVRSKHIKPAIEENEQLLFDFMY